MNRNDFYYCDLVVSYTNMDCFCRTFWREKPFFGGEIIGSGKRIDDFNNIIFETTIPESSNRWIICASDVPQSYATGKKILTGDLFYISENVICEYQNLPFIIYKESYIETEYKKIKTFLVEIKDN